MNCHEINLEVSERIMGWDKSMKRWAGHWYYSDQYDSHDCREPFNPAENITHAMEVVESFTGRGWGFGVIGYPTCSRAEPGPPYRVRFFADESEYDGHGTLPMAICLAALAAVKHKKDTPHA